MGRQVRLGVAVKRRNCKYERNNISDKYWAGGGVDDGAVLDGDGAVF